MNSNRPLVSILAPCYNGAGFLKKFFESLLIQEYKYLELIFINDGSKDNSEEVVFSYKDQLERAGISLIYEYRENAGIGAAIDRGLKLLHGKYFTWIGIDDYYHPQFFSKLVDFMENNPKYSVVRNDGFLVDENDNSIILGKMADCNHDKFNEYLFENAILERNFQFGYSVVRTEDFFKRIPSRSIYPSRHGQNWQILLPIFYYGLSAFYEEPLYYVLVNSSSVSRDPAKSGITKLLEQKDEYKKILVETLYSFELPDRNKYLAMVDEKYARMKMRIGYNFKNKDVFDKYFKMLKLLGKANWKDYALLFRSLFSFHK